MERTNAKSEMGTGTERGGAMRRAATSGICDQTEMGKVSGGESSMTVSASGSGSVAASGSASGPGPWSVAASGSGSASEPKSESRTSMKSVNKFEGTSMKSVNKFELPVIGGGPRKFEE